MLGGGKPYTPRPNAAELGRGLYLGPVEKPKLSASRIKSLTSCSWEFFCSGCLKLPERIWSKTFVGSLCHLVLECLAKDNPKRREYFKTICSTGTHTSVPSIARLVEKYKRNNPLMEEKHSVDLDDLLMVALNYDFYFEAAKKVLPPEFRFELELGESKTKVKGFVDRVAFYDGYAVVRDYKSQGKRFTEDELENNIQAAVYQLAIMEKFGLPARVEFLLLRFPGNKANPTRFLQVVDPKTPNQLKGLIGYLEHLNIEFQNFTIEKARHNLKAFKDIGFCRNVCGFREPFVYYAATKEGKITRTSKEEIQANVGELVTKHFYSGCPYFHSGEGKARNFN